MKGGENEKLQKVAAFEAIANTLWTLFLKVLR